MIKFRPNIALALMCLAFIMPARAASFTSSLDVISDPSIGSGSLGVVTVTQNSANVVEFNVMLSPNTAFVSNGGPHNAFTFNLDLLTPYTITFVNPTNGTFTYNAGNVTNTPYGIFSNGIDCPGCGPGGSHAYSGVLDFTITDASGINLNNIVANPLGYYFSADVIGPSRGTGNIASTMSPVPEPRSYSMLLAGLALIGFTARHRKNNFM